MAYIPKDAEWFLAQLVVEIRVEGYKRNIVQIDYVLIQANTPNKAYKEAMKLGAFCNSRYKNPGGAEVIHRFLGLRDLDVICEPLEHGCEIMFEERLGLGKKSLGKLVRSKDQLEAFLPIRRRPGRPDYSSKEIMDEVAKRLKKTRH